MKSFAPLLTAALNAGLAFASPLTTGPGSVGIHNLGDSAVTRRSLSNLEASFTGESNLQDAYTTIYSPWWSGAVSTGNNLTNVTGTFTLPKITRDAEGWTTGMAIFVGMDGLSEGCQDNWLFVSLILASGTGVDGYLDNWWPDWEWKPNFETFDNMVDFPVKAGDKIRLSVFVTTPTTGTGTIENLSTGQKMTKYMYGSSPLCQKDGTWVVADYESMLEPMRFANFSTSPVKFTDVGATEASGKVIGLESELVTLIQLNQTGQGGILTNCGIKGASSLECARKY